MLNTYYSLGDISGSVMRNRSVGIIFGSLVLWGVITYFLFLDQPSGRDQEKVVNLLFVVIQSFTYF